MSDTTSGDSAELEALFDSIVNSTGKAASPAATEPVAPPEPAVEEEPSMKPIQGSEDPTEDSRDLQELFDSIVGGDGSDTAAENTEWPAQRKVFNEVGQMVRQLRNVLGALGYDKLIEKTAREIPDARNRLKYIADLTEQAACKVLNATDVANPLQEELEADAARLAAKWDALYANQMGVEDFKLLAGETRAFLKTTVPQRASVTRQQLLEIMMAQDFQDLTGQVIKKVLALVEENEARLMSILIDTIPEEKHTESVKTLLNGPVIDGEGRADVVVNQRQVDDLLDSLGF
ncbi:MAG: protein phosphatase CheZ [Candidatus Accumulibacter sp.]|jgi:chemotaxis protein CheZ|nr:protein phosphatase CheZ [Accumulibacter sp.]